jgi:hypothetical protein
MAVDAVLVVGVVVLEVIGEAADNRSLATGLDIEIGVTPTGVDGPVVEPDAGQAAELAGISGYASQLPLP